MSMFLLIEIISVCTGLLYIILLMQENIWCWVFGIISSLLSIYLFYMTTLYAESILYMYYVIIGIYAWTSWQKKLETAKAFPITKLQVQQLILWIIVGALGTYVLSVVFEEYTDAARPLIDSATTIFAFIATYLQAQKKLDNWSFWIVINSVSIWLYYDRGLKIYALLMAVYVLLSILGLINWRRKLALS